MSMEKPEAILAAEALARMVDYPLLDGGFTEEDVHSGCQLALELALGSVTVRPCDLGLAAKWVHGSEVSIGSLAGGANGEETTAVKVYAARDLLQRGARHIQTVINVGKMRSRQFQYIEIELLQLAQECHRAGAALIIELPVEMLGDDHRVIVCRIAKRVEADYIRPVPSAGSLSFFASRLGEIVKLDAGPVATADEARSAYSAGARRLAAANPRALLDSCRAAVEKDAGVPGV
jgi:deoxyribose-phosphate aldolase